VVHWGTTRPHTSTRELMGRTSTLTDTSQVDAERQARIDGAGDNAALGFFMASGDEGARIRETDLVEQMSDSLSADFSKANAAQLLGYTKALRELSTHSGVTATEETLRSDLESERYFIIIKAYSLHDKPPPGLAQKAVWTLHMNMRAPGINFQTALDRMSVTAVDFFGRTTDDVKTVSPGMRKGTVEVGTPIVIAEKR
jgi:hypothetical protein